MPDPTILYGVGATKAGTSWLYRYLHEHPDCALPAVKEAHYWDTFADDARDKQVARFQKQLQRLSVQKDAADAEGRDGKADNIARRMSEMAALVTVLQADRADDLAYASWLLKGRETATLVADITPSYSLLPDEMLERMLRLSPASTVIYLIRDPLDRLWSHIRMLAGRQMRDGDVFETKANSLLSKMLTRGAGPIFQRGDYRANIPKLRRVIPEGRLLVQFFEDLFTVQGVRRVCAFLGITPVDRMRDRVVHAGQRAVMCETLRPKAMEMLNDQYEWVARNVGPLPQRWQDNQARMHA